MEIIQFFIELLRNTHSVLESWILAYGLYFYAILFLIIFVETA